MAALAAKLALALGFDTLLQWVLRTLVALVVIGLLVTLIVVQTVAGVLTGGRTSGATGTLAPVIGEHPLPCLCLTPSRRVQLTSAPPLSILHRCGSACRMCLGDARAPASIAAASSRTCTRRPASVYHALPSISSTPRYQSAIHSPVTLSSSLTRTSPESAMSASTLVTAYR